ncbi:CDP-glucose 4,6-dehydratase [Cohnella thermotolerans]|uniref:CDP-glucose 4,6-dehydratase n=1 Tax=Cohnella thermotolerans TaxID=329858 RepID=UPI0004073C10|nr:CDP-glucose 4,6-dehydratase [Cohnella thermotolerans]
MIDREFWKNKRVFLTGHTGFKGSWLSLWLVSLGAKVTGYARTPETTPNLYELCHLDEMVHSNIGDVRDYERLRAALFAADPEIVIHMAAQPLVKHSYQFPVETYQTNVMGTVHLLESVRSAVQNGKTIKAVVNVTTDKCYDNKNWVWGYREQDVLGGFDPYSNSKACSELVTASYRNSFFHPHQYDVHGVALASARAGNVIGGGDWAQHRLIPDCVRALLNKDVIKLRNPQSIRPWQHVLEPLSGYLLLAQQLYETGPQFAQAWNFGPDDIDAKHVEWVVEQMCALWGDGAAYEIDHTPHLHEDHYLKLDNSKAKMELGWHPRWNIRQRIEKVVEWTFAYKEQQDIRAVCFKQLEEFNSPTA